MYAIRSYYEFGRRAFRKSDVEHVCGQVNDAFHIVHRSVDPLQQRRHRDVAAGKQLRLTIEQLAYGDLLCRHAFQVREPLTP